MIERHEYNGFVYKMDYSKNDLQGFDIEHPRKKPEYIYKYYGISSYSVDAIVNGYFYASHPIELNDDLDSSNFLLGASKPLEFELYKRFLGTVISSDKELLSFYEKDSVADDGFYAKGLISELWQLLSSKFGIISLTAEDKNLLMWPHYTQEKGIQIKFKASELEKSIIDNNKSAECLGIYPVNYSSKLSPIDISDFRMFHVPFLYLTNVKSESWKYEDEWRFIISREKMGVPFSKSGLDPREDFQVVKDNRKAFYDSNIVEEITLGNNFFTGREFRIDRSLKKGFTVVPINSENNWNYENHKNILNHISSNLPDKLFYSGKTFKIDDEGVPYLIRTKERFNIRKINRNKYLLTRTNEFY